MTSIQLDRFRGAAALLIGAGALAAWISAPSAAAGGDAVINVRLANGVNARVFPPDYLAARTAIDADRGVLDLGNGEYFSLITEISDPLITNKGDGEFHPFGTELVIDCLGQITYPSIDLDIDVFVLPYPRSNTLSSSASGRRIFLSPHVLEISREGAAYIVAHELGHVFQYAYLPDPTEDRWTEYRRIRGIRDESKFWDYGPHAYRPREIFAEDFRVLFGGPAAHTGGRVENPEVSSPVTVAGLEEFFLGLTTPAGAPSIVSVVSFPNPFNPQTEIRAQLSPEFLSTGRPVTVRIYDVTGALVRDLFAGRPAGPEIRVMWDGCDRGGRRVASSTYFGVVEAGDARSTAKLLMIK